ncbi:MAG: 6-carboxytetrahydropterin synthase [Phycisphaerales bacterium]|jgi:6-pyruvoyltetrahydropterin/6-carboxytetrahydropterin synthase|nr:6-carboxytetrahydropterin synthase [Phycisphaerales bacterium]
MFRLEVSGVFSAAHAILIRGQREPLHGHDWHVTATLEGPELDEDGLLLDFHAVEEDLRGLCAVFHHRSLNETPPFDQINPTAERVAEFLAHSLEQKLRSRSISLRDLEADSVFGRKTSSTPASVPARVVSVRVTEAVGCAATCVLPAG